MNGRFKQLRAFAEMQSRTITAGTLLNGLKEERKKPSKNMAISMRILSGDDSKRNWTR